jgi:LuxR family maltose regulon positive regulatory protein
MTPAGARSSAAPRPPSARRGRSQGPSRIVEFPGVSVLDLDEAKLALPLPARDSVSRTALVNRLRVPGSYSVVTLLAPAGYGKTTLLAQWAAREKRSFGWVSLDDDDPTLLLRYVATALARAQAIDSSVLDALLRARRSARAATRLLASALFSVGQPVALVLDDVQRLRSQECVDALSALVDHVPHGSTLVLSGRKAPALPLARLRAEGRVLELGVDELALTRREVLLLLRNAGVEPPEGDVSGIVDRTEGWAAGVYFAALALQDAGAEHGSEEFAGDDRFVADYLRSEYLSCLRRTEVRFLTRTSVLDRMSGPLCDAVVESKRSAQKLEALETSNLFLVPLDRHRGWYRYHRLFRDLLRAELAQREPELVPALNRRAASWYEANGSPEAAVDYARAAGDTETVARLVGELGLPVYHSGRVATLERWLDHFRDDDCRLARYPGVAVLGAWIHVLHGRQATAERYLHALEDGTAKRPLPDGSPSTGPWLALLRAAMCRNGPEQMHSEAEAAIRQLGPRSPWRPAALLLRGAAQLLLGHDDCADASMAEAIDVAESSGATETRVVALAERSLLAEARGDHADAKALGREARAAVDEGGLGDHPTSAIALAASARAELRTGSWEQARFDLERASRLRGLLAHVLPWLSLQTRLELARAQLALSDASGARVLLSEADEIRRRRPALGVLVEQAAELRAESDTLAATRAGPASPLTPAELRLLPLLATHLSFREIGERLYVSRNTVKTQAISVYRKLGVSSRSEAIERAADLGLGDRPAVSPPDFTLTG